LIARFVLQLRPDCDDSIATVAVDSVVVVVAVVVFVPAVVVVVAVAAVDIAQRSEQLPP